MNRRSRRFILQEDIMEYVITGHESSILPDGVNWRLVWNDEFDGSKIDDGKWRFREYMMGHRHKTWSDSCASLDGKSNLILSLVEKDGDFFTSQLETGENYMDRPGKTFAGRFVWPIGKISTPKFMHRFGYYECRCRLQKNPGWWSAFWLQSPIQGCTLNPAFSGVEIDIMESFKPGYVSHAVHWNGCGEDLQSKGKQSFPLVATPDGFHRFGLRWNKTGYTFFVDGKESWHVDGPVSETEQFVLVSTECMGYRTEEEKPCTEVQGSAPDEFVVDYVRVFDEI